MDRSSVVDGRWAAVAGGALALAATLLPWYRTAAGTVAGYDTLGRLTAVVALVVCWHALWGAWDAERGVAVAAGGALLAVLAGAKLLTLDGTPLVGLGLAVAGGLLAVAGGALGVRSAEGDVRTVLRERERPPRHR
ncbi:MAG: hypothetical protein ABEJ70_00025 [Halobacteriaceae archaeon]